MKEVAVDMPEHAAFVRPIDPQSAQIAPPVLLAMHWLVVVKQVFVPHAVC